MQARRVEISIVYQGVVWEKNIQRYLTGVQYKDCASGDADQLEVQLSDKEGIWLRDWFPEKGDRIRAAVTLLNWNGDAQKEVFSCGAFTIDDIKFSGRPISVTLGALSMPIQEGFSTTEKTKTWKKATVRQIAQEIADTAGVMLYYDAPEIAIEEVEQSAKTDAAFLSDLCKDKGIAMKTYEDKIILFNEIQYEAKPPICTLKEQDFLSWDGTTTIYGIYDGVILSYQSSQNSKPFTYEFHPREGNRILKLNETVENMQEAEQVAKAKLREANRNETTLSITKKGDIRLVAGGCVLVEGLGKFDGKYYIDTVTHDVGQGYTTACELHKVIEGGY